MQCPAVEITEMEYGAAAVLQRPLVVTSCLWEFYAKNGPSTQLIDATSSCVKLWDNTIGAEELGLGHISSYQTLSADKTWDKL